MVATLWYLLISLLSSGVATLYLPAHHTAALDAS